jgi:hypothetical protein
LGERLGRVQGFDVGHEWHAFASGTSPAPHEGRVMRGSLQDSA